MYLMYRILGSPVWLILNTILFLYICQRLLRAMGCHHRLMAEIFDCHSIVQKARAGLDYIGEEVSKGMDEIKEDIGEELHITERLTNVSAKVSEAVRHFAIIEEDVIELLRTNRNAENVALETPDDVTEEVRRLLKMSEKPNERERTENLKESDSKFISHGAARGVVHRNPVSKFSALATVSPPASPREKQDRPRTPVIPEVRLLPTSVSPRIDKKID